MFLAWNFLANFSRLRSMAPWTFQKVRERTLSLLRYHPSDQFRLRRTGRTPISAILSQSPEEFRIILIFNASYAQINMDPENYPSSSDDDGTDDILTSYAKIASIGSEDCPALLQATTMALMVIASSSINPRKNCTAHDSKTALLQATTALMMITSSSGTPMLRGRAVFHSEENQRRNTTR